MYFINVLLHLNLNFGLNSEINLLDIIWALNPDFPDYILEITDSHIFLFVLFYFIFFQHNFCVEPYVPREPRRDPSNRSSMNMGYISHTARNQTQNLFRPKQKPIPLGQSDSILLALVQCLLHIKGICQSINQFPTKEVDPLELTNPI